MPQWVDCEIRFVFSGDGEGVRASQPVPGVDRGRGIEGIEGGNRLEDREEERAGCDCC